MCTIYDSKVSGEMLINISLSTKPVIRNPSNRLEQRNERKTGLVSFDYIYLSLYHNSITVAAV
jgi:hypothetical protein